MRCPKCGSGNEAGAWVCGRCEYVLDTSFLGDDILNVDPDPAAPPSVQTKPVRSEGPSRDELGGDALILGKLDDGEIQSFVSDRTGGFLPVQADAVVEEAPANVYIGGAVAAQLAPTSVLRHAVDADGRRSALSKFEAYVYDLIDGHRNLGEVRGRTGLSQGDVRIAAAMLLDKHMVESTTAAKPEELARHAGEAPRPKPPALPVEQTGELPQLADATCELPELPPLASPVDEESWVEVKAPLAAPGPPPPPPPTPEPAPSAQAAPQPEPAPPAPAAPSGAPAFRPAARVAPLRAIRHTPPPPPKRPVDVPPPLPSPPRSRGPGTVPAAVDPKLRAAEYHELALRDLREGRPARAFSYARMAADADPREEKYQELLRDWNKASARGLDGDPVAAAQQAEATGDFERAIEHMKKACQQFPGSAPLHNRLGVLLATRAKDFRAAYNAAMRAVELEPENATYKSNMMKILARVEGSDEADAIRPGKGGFFGGILKR